MSNETVDFSYTGTIQTETISSSGLYDITATGAAGGVGGGGNIAGQGGLGAAVGGDIYLAAGTVLEILVGGKGTDGGGSPLNGQGGGGGGGSFVVETYNGATNILGNVVLAVAGGGGGGGGSDGGYVNNGQSGSPFTDGAKIGEGGTGGNGTFSEGGGGGGGYSGTGGTAHCVTTAAGYLGSTEGGFGGRSFEAGGTGGANGSRNFGFGYLTGGTGGFGGGGGGGIGSGASGPTTGGGPETGVGGGGGGGGGYTGGRGGLTDGGANGGYSYLDPSATGASMASGISTSDGNGKVAITEVLCYLRGTRILTSTGEVPVEALQAGDMVVTRFGAMQKIKWIGRQSFTGAFLAKHRDRYPVRIAVGALGDNLPMSDLIVSPGHSMLLGETLVLAKNLVNGITITQSDLPDLVDYYGIELKSHDCLLAEGVWSESFADGPGLRNQFHNITDFLSLFPGYVEPETVTLCAPRPENGPELEVALLPVLARAQAVPGTFRGYVETLGNDKVEGWAWDEANPDMPVLVEIREDAEILGRVLACHYRGDLAQAGLGRGHCSFSFILPAPKARTSGITVHIASDGAPLPLTGTARAA